MTEPQEDVQLDTIGPPDEKISSQEVVYEESESDDPNAETATEELQDLRP